MTSTSRGIRRPDRRGVLDQLPRDLAVDPHALRLVEGPVGLRQQAVHHRARVPRVVERLPGVAAQVERPQELPGVRRARGHGQGRLDVGGGLQLGDLGGQRREGLALQVQGDAELLERLLHQEAGQPRLRLGLGVEEGERQGLAGVPGLGQEPLGLRHVALEARQPRLVRRREALRQRAVRHLGVALVDLDHPLVVEGVLERLAEPHVLERPLLRVERDHRDAEARRLHQLDAGLARDLLRVLGDPDGRQHDQVGVALLQQELLGPGARDDALDHLGDVAPRPALPVVGELVEHELLALVPAGEPVGPGAVHGAREVGGAAVGVGEMGLPGDEHLGEPREERDRGLRRDQADGHPVDDLDLLEGLEEEGPAPAHRLRALDRQLDRLRVEERAVVELDVRAELQLDRAPVGGDGPRLGQRGRQLRRVAAVLEEPLVDLEQHPVARARHLDRRVHRLGLGGNREGHRPRHLGRRRPGQGHGEGEQPERQDASTHESPHVTSPPPGQPASTG